MRIQSLQIKNYKGFMDSSSIEFGPGFNVIVGPNNVGKSSILETLRLQNAAHHPHRRVELDRGVPPPSISVFDISIAIRSDEFAMAVIQAGGIRWPVNQNILPGAPAYLDGIMSHAWLEFDFRSLPGQALQSSTSPPHRYLEAQPWVQNPAYLDLAAAEDRKSLVVAGTGHSSSDTIAGALNPYVLSHIFVFDPQRMNVGSCAFGDSDILLANASNLPQVLFKLNTNPARYERFVAHVREIFPSIHYVSVVPHGTALEIRIWSVEKESEREDIACGLNNGGTGVGQVLSILYVAMTMSDAVIAIDEPSNFLHPGAVKKLIGILQGYNRNQYIIATHSTEAILTCDPTTMYSVSWEGGESKISRVERATSSELRGVLGDLGISLSDVFGPEAVIWVEGQTEEECFPIICRQAVDKSIVGINFLAMRSTSEIERTNKKANAVIDTYAKLSSSGSVFPPALAFSFDRELRTQDMVADLERRPARTVVLQRRTFENYLLNPQAVHHAMAQESEIISTVEDVEVWISENYKRYLPKKSEWWPGGSWEETVNAPELLKELFHVFTGGRLEYRKIRHGGVITTWMLENEPAALSEVIIHLKKLLN